MNPVRSVLLLVGLALLGATAGVNEIMADAQAPLLNAAGEAARGYSNAEPPALAGNPLWALPIEQLSMTRERPIFSPSRRPRPPSPAFVAPMVVRQPTKPAEPERPAVSLIGVVRGTDLQIGVFLDKATQSIVRLRVGEEHQGWVLRLVKPREVTLVKDVEQILALEPTGGGTPAARVPTVLPLVPNSIGTMPVINTADYVDEQPLPAGGAKRQRR